MGNHSTFSLILWCFFFVDKERPYLIVKAVIRLSDPAAMDLVLRKRICFNVYKRHSITDKIRRRMGHTSNLTSLGVVYEIVSNIPKVIFDYLFHLSIFRKVIRPKMSTIFQDFCCFPLLKFKLECKWIHGRVRFTCSLEETRHLHTYIRLLNCLAMLLGHDIPLSFKN